MKNYLGEYNNFYHNNNEIRSEQSDRKYELFETPNPQYNDDFHLTINSFVHLLFFDQSIYRL